MYAKLSCNNSQKRVNRAKLVSNVTISIYILNFGFSLAMILLLLLGRISSDNNIILARLLSSNVAIGTLVHKTCETYSKVAKEEEGKKSEKK